MPLYKITFHDVFEGRVSSNIFPYNPLQIFGESPDQSRELFEWTPPKKEYNYFLNWSRGKSKSTSMGQISTRTISREQFGGAIPTCAYTTAPSKSIMSNRDMDLTVKDEAINTQGSLCD